MAGKGHMHSLRRGLDCARQRDTQELNDRPWGCIPFDVQDVGGEADLPVQRAR